MDEKTVVGEELLDRAIAVPFFLVVPGILEETYWLLPRLDT